MGNKTGKETSRQTYDSLENEDSKEPGRLGIICEAKEDFRQANVLFRESKIDQAKVKYGLAVAKLKQSDDPTAGQHRAIALPNLGALAFAEGRYEEAKELVTQAEELHKQNVPGNDRENNWSLCSLAIALKRDISVHRTPETQTSLAAELKEHGNIDAITADLMNNLGACHEVSGDLEQARHFYEESLKIRSLVFGERSLKSAESMQNLATVLDYLSETEQAGNLLTKALNIEEEVHGLDSVECSVTLNNLGVLSARLNKLTLAHSLLQRAYLIRLRAFGKNNHLTIRSKQNLDFVFSRIDKEHSV